MRHVVVCCERKLVADSDALAGPIIGMTTGVHVILASATGFEHCCEILRIERDYSMTFSLGAETGALLEQSARQEGDLSLVPFPKMTLLCQLFAGKHLNIWLHFLWLNNAIVLLGNVRVLFR